MKKLIEKYKEYLCKVVIEIENSRSSEMEGVDVAKLYARKICYIKFLKDLQRLKISLDS